MGTKNNMVSLVFKQRSICGRFDDLGAFVASPHFGGPDGRKPRQSRPASECTRKGANNFGAFVGLLPKSRAPEKVPMCCSWCPETIWNRRASLCRLTNGAGWEERVEPPKAGRRETFAASTQALTDQQLNPLNPKTLNP